MFWAEEVGALAKNIGTSFKDAVSAFKADPTKVLELEAAAEKAQREYEALALQAVNATMQAEAKSEHWMQWAWRPTFGFSGAAVIVNNYILLPYLVNFGIKPIDIPSEVWMSIMAVVGVAAWSRGRSKP